MTLGELAVLFAASSIWVALVTALGPTLLSMGTWWHRWPSVALFCWWVALASVIGAAVVAVLAVCVALAIVVVHVSSTTLKVSLELAITGIGAAAVALASYVIGRGERSVRSQREVRRHLDTLVATHGIRVERRTGYDLVVLDTPAPLALSATGHPPRILLSRGLVDSLSVEQLNAVIWHERGHLELRHESLIRLTALVARLVPWAPAAGRMSRAVMLLTELSADAVASDHAGAAHVAAAMDRLREAEANGATQREGR